MSWRVAIGFNTPWADVSWLDGDDVRKAREVISKYCWQRPLRISYLKGYEDMMIKFAELLKATQKQHH